MRNKIFKTFSVVIFLMVFSKGLGLLESLLLRQSMEQVLFQMFMYLRMEL